MEDNSTPPQVTTVEVAVDAEIAQGRYANHVAVQHTPEEFILDFIFLRPPQGTLNARVILHPSHCKRFLQALQDNLRNYEETFGEVPSQITPRDRR